MSDVSPQRSHAIVVGVEAYAAGPSWNLDGPASDAVRMLEYVRACDVPKAHTQAFLAPLPQNGVLRDRAMMLAETVREPTQAALDDLIEQWLPSLQTDLLLVFWAGHGVITVDDERRLYTADATADIKRNVDVNSLLATLRTDRYPHVTRQMVIVDTCANYIPSPTERLTHKSYTNGNGVAGVDQFALFAASPGEYAKNLNTEKTGLLTRELLALLPTPRAEVWPPAGPLTAEALARRFITLRQQRQTRQTPSTFWFRGPTNSGSYKATDGAYLAQMGLRAVGAAGPARRLSPADKKVLLEALLQLDSMRRQKDRDWIVRQLRPEIGTNIDRSDRDRVDTLMILERSHYYDGLLELLQAIDLLEAQSPAFKSLVSVAHGLFPDEVPEGFDA
jgi:Caspase domain/Effector-associated domain 2